jgi:hypothetical protein
MKCTILLRLWDSIPIDSDRVTADQYQLNQLLNALRAFSFDCRWKRATHEALAIGDIDLLPEGV